MRITQHAPRGAKLAADKGINLPTAAASGRDDRQGPRGPGLRRGHADMVALSFANTVDDVRALQTLLVTARRSATRRSSSRSRRSAARELPAMLLEAMKAPRCGVMIARGDLAVECGFERLAEVQEEILWICEAAHVPVIWATQVLESLAKNGQPSRAEITDAAMSHRAECVMLNKGPTSWKRSTCWTTSCAACTVTRRKSARCSANCDWSRDSGEHAKPGQRAPHGASARDHGPRCPHCAGWFYEISYG